MSFNFSPPSLYFKYCIIANIIATTLIPRKVSLSNITYWDMFILYCMVKKYKINWAYWFREYMFKSVADAHTSASLPYGLLITRILLYYSIDLSIYPIVEVSTTYDSKIYANIWYILVDHKWCKKDSAKEKSDLLKVIKSVSNPMLLDWKNWRILRIA